MEGLRSRAKSRAKSGFAQLPRELLQRIYAHPVLEAQDRCVQDLDSCAWQRWGHVSEALAKEPTLVAGSAFIHPIHMTR